MRCYEKEIHLFFSSLFFFKSIILVGVYKESEIYLYNYREMIWSEYLKNHGSLKKTKKKLCHIDIKNDLSQMINKIKYSKSVDGCVKSRIYRQKDTKTTKINVIRLMITENCSWLWLVWFLASHLKRKKKK